MRREEWRKIEELLDVALELEPTERRRFLAGLDVPPDLRIEFESLLACDEHTNGFLNAPAMALSADFFDEDNLTEARAGQHVGAYRILREIGRGGMGTVFLAERADGQFEQSVALKVVRRSFADTDLARRFRQERQILASLNHPNIARLLDGGVSVDGEPFLAMEYVEGLRIDAYADVHQLSTHERLRLFRQVCGAVQYAHQNLVIHRDLKPSNILVTAEGVPKLLDFGIAKLLDAENGGAQTVTAVGVMTPEYASPEQVRGESVTTASDVYSLGVVLYELLTGRRPYRVTGRRPDEIARAIREQEPLKPSEARSEPPASAGPVLNPRDDARGSDLKSLRGDLDNIVLMAMRKEPSRRYASVAQFAEDIRRHLDGLPVLARKDTFKYRATKFVNRNKMAVAAAALVTLALIGGILGVVWQARAASEKAILAAAKQVEAEESRGRAEREAEKTRKILAFMERVLSYASPAWYAEGNQLRGQARLIDVLNEMAGKIESEFPGDLDIQAELHHKCAEIFLANQMIDSAEAHARRALELRRRVFGERHAEVAKDLYYLGAMAGQQGKTLECKKLFLQAAGIFREVAPGNANLAYLLEDLGSIEAEIFGDAYEADRVLTESLELFRRGDGDAHHNTARLYLALSVNAARLGETARADELFGQGERRMAILPHADAPLEIAVKRGELEFAKGNSAAAETILKQIIVDARKVKGEENPLERVARYLLAQVYKREKDWAKWAEVLRAQVAARRKTLPNTSVTFAQELAALSVVLLRAGRTAEARPIFEESYRMFRRNDYGEEVMQNLKISVGEALLLLQRRDEAVPLIEAAYEYSVANLPPKHRDRIHVEAVRAESRAGVKS